MKTEIEQFRAKDNWFINGSTSRHQHMKGKKHNLFLFSSKR